MDKVIVLSCKGTDQALEALDGLRRLHDEGDIRIEAIAVVERTENGRTVMLEQAEELQIKATAAGGVIGAIIGLLSGPFGLLVGGATGAVVGSLVDVADVESSDTLLRSFGPAVPPGRAAAIAVVEEAAPAAVDTLAAELGVPTLRRPRAEVEEKLAEAEESVLAAERDADSKRTIGDRLRDVKEAVVDRS